MNDIATELVTAASLDSTWSSAVKFSLYGIIRHPGSDPKPNNLDTVVEHPFLSWNMGKPIV